VRHDARRHTYTERFIWYSHCISRDAKALLVYIQLANHEMYVEFEMRRNAPFGVFHTNSAGARFIQNFKIILRLRVCFSSEFPNIRVNQELNMHS